MSGDVGGFHILGSRKIISPLFSPNILMTSIIVDAMSLSIPCFEGLVHSMVAVMSIDAVVPGPRGDGRHLVRCW